MGALIGRKGNRRIMGYGNKFNRGIARVQKELVENGNGKASFTVNKVTVFSVRVTNAKSNIINDSTDVSFGPEVDFKEMSFSDKSLKVLTLCAEGAYSKKELLLRIGVTNQTINVRNIINPLIISGCLAPVEEDKDKFRHVRYEATARGKAYLSFLSGLGKL